VKIENDFRFLTEYNGSGRPGMEEMLDALVQAGYSNTQARRAVLAAICRVQGPASSADILALGRAYHPALGEVTVYRTLDILSSLGLVRRLHTEDGCHTYALATHGHGHHVICQRCKRAVEFEGCDIGQVVNAVERQTGFRVADHWLEIFGLCPECQNSVAEQADEQDG
jgi:Fur family transcriptional regulator, ferric uptake regulator